MMNVRSARARDRLLAIAKASDESSCELITVLVDDVFDVLAALALPESALANGERQAFIYRFRRA